MRSASLVVSAVLVALVAGGPGVAREFAHSQAQADASRMVVFEMFGRASWPAGTAAGASVVNALAREPGYADRAVWIEHDLDDRQDTRRTRWWSRRRVDDPSDTAPIPLVLVDSGHGYTLGNAEGDYEGTYRRLVDSALAQSPCVSVTADQEVTDGGTQLRVHGRIVNTGSVVLGQANDATLWIVAYVERRRISVDRFAVASASWPLDRDLAPGEPFDFDKTMGGTIAARDIADAKTIVIVDYQPSTANGAYASANAALAIRSDTARETPTPSPRASTASPTPIPNRTPPPTLAPQHLRLPYVANGHVIHTPTPTSTPCPTPTRARSPYDGGWFGSGEHYEVRMRINHGVIELVILTLAVNEHCTKYEYLSDIPITGNGFAVGGLISGTFASPSSVAGHLSYRITSGECAGSIDTTWSAVKRTTPDPLAP